GCDERRATGWGAPDDGWASGSGVAPTLPSKALAAIAIGAVAGISGITSTAAANATRVKNSPSGHRDCSAVEARRIGGAPFVSAGKLRPRCPVNRRLQQLPILPPHIISTWRSSCVHRDCRTLPWLPVEREGAPPS